MFQQSYPIAGPDLILNFEHGGGDLHLHGSDESYLRIQGEGEPNDYKAQWQNGVLTMRLHEDCVFFVPRKLNLRVSGRFGDLDVNELAGNLVISGGNDVMINTATGNVEIGSVSGDLKATELGALKVSDRIAGDAIIASVAGAVQLETVSGDLIVNDAQSLSVAQDIHGSAKISNVGSPVQLGEVMGDLTVRDIHGGVTAREVKGSLKAVDIDGDLTIAEVAGEAKIHSVAGSVVIHNVAGDARLEDIEGFVHSFEAGGDLHITPNLTGGEAYEFKAGGDLVILIDESTPAKFQCAAGGEVISRLSGYAVRKAGSWTHEIGEGGPTVRLEAGGDVKIKPQEEGNVEFRVEINQEEMRRAKEEVKRAKEEIKRVQRELRDQLRAQRHEMRDTVRASLRHGIRQGIRAGIGHGISMNMPHPPHAPKPPKMKRSFSFTFPDFDTEFGPTRPDEPARAAPKREVSEEERMSILKMLEEKRITPEQAEMLLSALGDE